MTKEQREDLLIEWGLYEPRDRWAMIDEYRQLRRKEGSKVNFPDFLKDRIDIAGYWENFLRLIHNRRGNLSALGG